MTSYECQGCFSTSLINSLKSAKGHSVTEANENRITIKTITKLSGSYDSAKYKGTSKLSEITAAGGSEVGGAGGCDDTLTSAICKEYHLDCQ